MIELKKLFDLDLDSYYLIQSYEVSRNCEEGVGFKVGCVIVKNDEMITGFNKTINGDDFKLAIHAECDAIANCARRGISTEDSTLYCNLQPCPDCAKLIIACKIKKVVYGDIYSIRRYEIVDKESYNKRLYPNKEPILIKFHTDNSKKMFEENNVELKYIDIYALMYSLKN